MKAQHIPDLFVKSPVSTTGTWGSIVAQHGIKEDCTASNHLDSDWLKLATPTASHSKSHAAFWVCEHHKWRSSETEENIFGSSTGIFCFEDSNTSLANVDTACRQLYFWEASKQGRLASVFAVIFVEKNFAAMNLEAINSLLLQISVKNLTEWSMVAILRASYSAKEKLPAWNIFYKSVKRALDGNERAPRLLAGLED